MNAWTVKWIFFFHFPCVLSQAFSSSFFFYFHSRSREHQRKADSSDSKYIYTVYACTLYIIKRSEEKFAFICRHFVWQRFSGRCFTGHRKSCVVCRTQLTNQPASHRSLWEWLRPNRVLLPQEFSLCARTNKQTLNCDFKYSNDTHEKGRHLQEYCFFVFFFSAILTKSFQQ